MKFLILLLMFATLLPSEGYTGDSKLFPGLMRDSETPVNLHANSSATCMEISDKGKIIRTTEFYVFSYVDGEDAGNAGIRYQGLMVDSTQGQSKEIREITYTTTGAKVQVDHGEDNYVQTWKFDSSDPLRKGTFIYSDVIYTEAPGEDNWELVPRKPVLVICKTQ